jgi:hypothetical protein
VIRLPLADIGLSLELVLVGLAGGVLLLIAIAAVAAGLGVLIFGPRKLDSLIIPGMATFGVMVVVLFDSRWLTAPLPALGALFATVGIGTSAIQRLVGDRLDPTSVHWPRFIRVGSIAAGATVGGFLGFVSNRQGGPYPVLAGALVGVIVATFASRKGTAPLGEVEPAADSAASRPGD